VFNTPKHRECEKSHVNLSSLESVGIECLGSTFGMQTLDNPKVVAVFGLLVYLKYISPQIQPIKICYNTIKKGAIMQTIQFKVDNNYVDVVLNMLKTLNNLKLNVVKDLLIIDNSKKDDKWDKFFERLEEVDTSDFMQTRLQPPLDNKELF